MSTFVFLHQCDTNVPGRMNLSSNSCRLYSLSGSVMMLMRTTPTTIQMIPMRSLYTSSPGSGQLESIDIFQAAHSGHEDHSGIILSPSYIVSQPSIILSSYHQHITILAFSHPSSSSPYHTSSSKHPLVFRACHELSLLLPGDVCFALLTR